MESQGAKVAQGKNDFLERQWLMMERGHTVSSGPSEPLHFGAIVLTEPNGSISPIAKFSSLGLGDVAEMYCVGKMDSVFS